MDNVSNYAPQIQTLARTILARVKAGEEGLTVDWTGSDLRPKNAYTVGGVTDTLVISNEQDYSVILLAVTNWLAAHHGLMHYAPIGVWLNKGHLYFDLVTVLPIDSGYANVRAIAHARGEIAFGEFGRNGDHLMNHNVFDF